MTLEQRVAEGADVLQLTLPPQSAQRLANYARLIEKWNRAYNLTAVRDIDEMVTLHLLDSLAVVPHLHAAASLLDVGSGAGLPGIPLAIACPAMAVTMLDANQKKTTFIKQAIAELGLANAEVVCERLEHCRVARGFDVVISRAFADLAQFVSLAARFVAPGGRLLAMKGTAARAELDALPEGFTIDHVTPLRIPGLDAQRHLIDVRVQRAETPSMQ